MSQHILIKEDLALLRQIREAVKQNIKPDRKKIRSLLLCKAALYFLLPGIFYTALFWVQNSYAFCLAYAGYGISLILLALNFGHDLSHNTVFSKRRWNSFFFHFIFLLLGGDGKAWRNRHVRSHHLAPNVDGHDTDLEISSLVRLTPESAKKKYHRFQHLYAPVLYGFYSLFWIFIKDPLVFFSQKQKAKEKLIFAGAKLLYVSYLFVIPALFSDVTFTPVFIGFLLMHLAQSWFVLFTFLITHHVEACEHPVVNAKGVIEASWMMNQVRSSNDFYPFSRLANFIFGGFNNHVAHHLLPELNHLYYPQVNRILYPILQKSGVCVNSSGYFKSIGSHLRLLRKYGNE